MIQRKQYDVVVVGGGPSGVAAAVAASRNSCKTLLIERGSCLGGMATQALVPAFGPFTNAEVDLIGRIGREILEKMKEGGYQSPCYDRIKELDWYQIEPISGWYVDEDIKTIKLGRASLGLNTLELCISFDGKFGLGRTHGEAAELHGYMNTG